VSSAPSRPRPLSAPTRENIKRIARGYGVSEDFLLDLVGRPELDAADEDERRERHLHGNATALSAWAAYRIAEEKNRRTENRE